MIARGTKLGTMRARSQNLYHVSFAEAQFLVASNVNAGEKKQQRFFLPCLTDITQYTNSCVQIETLNPENGSFIFRLIRYRRPVRRNSTMT